MILNMNVSECARRNSHKTIDKQQERLTLIYSFPSTTIDLELDKSLQRR